MNVVHYIGGIIVFLMVVGGISRIVTMPNIAAYIKNAFSAVTNLYNGAFA